MAGSMTRGAAISAPAAVRCSHCAAERRQLIMQADHTKYNRAALFKYGNLSGIDVLVTGGELPERDAYRLESAGLKQVIRA